MGVCLLQITFAPLLEYVLNDGTTRMEWIEQKYEFQFEAWRFPISTWSMS